MSASHPPNPSFLHTLGWAEYRTGKILRMRDDGSVSPDNSFVGKSGYKPYIYSTGHRVQLGLAVNPYNGEMVRA